MSARGDIGPGSLLGPYTLLHPLGQGASAQVFAAEDASGRRVAVKARRAATARGAALEEMDRRFLREFEAMRTLRVNGVVRVHEAGVDGDWLWYSMDLVEGRPFHEVFSGAPGDRIPRVRKLGTSLLQIVAAIHEAGFVHRDIKPSNVLVDEADRVTVLDFGIGRYFGDHDTLSHTGEILGTVPYMAPEQISGLPCDEKIDLFAVGLCLYESVAGARPRPSSTVGWIPRTCLESLPPLATTWPDIPRDFGWLVDRLLAVDPMDRPSARRAAALLAVEADAGGPEWPTPAFVEPGGDWRKIESVLGGEGDATPIWVLEGPTGSGRRRLAEQVHRSGLLSGVWTIPLRCRIERVGAVFLELLELLARLLDDQTLARVVGQSAAAIRQSWPHLPLPKPSDRPAAELGLVDALAAVVAALANVRPVVLQIRDLEQVDPVSARVIEAIAARRPKDVGLLLLHESRWATDDSRAVVARLVAGGAGKLDVGRMSASAGTTLARAVAPAAAPTVDRAGLALSAMLVGWQALARWRGETFVSPDRDLAPLAVFDRPIPTAVYRRLFGEPERRPGVVPTDDGIALDGETARLLLRSLLVDPRRAAASLGAAFEAALGDRGDATADTATCWLLAGDVGRAWAPAARAVVHQDQLEEYVTARLWLQRLDTLPLAGAARRDPADDFELAAVQLQVALHTELDDASEALFAVLERLTTSDEQELRVRLLRAEADLRRGDARPALVAALRIGATAAASQLLKVHAILTAVRCRIVLRQVPEAIRDGERAEVLLAELPHHPTLRVRLANLQAEIALLQDDLVWCRALCQKNIRTASQSRYLHGIAEASWRLGLALRMLGRRREAEHQVRSAVDAAAATGDVSLRASCELVLATLLAERGLSQPARVKLDDTIRRIRTLSLTPLLGPALRLALRIATVTGDQTDANDALQALSQVTPDPETPAALVSFWRSRGDLGRALAVRPARDADERAFGFVLWQIEHARALLANGREAEARTLAVPVAARAAALGFGELELYARLLLGALGPTEAELTDPVADDAAWAQLLSRAVGTVWCEVFLGALEMDARRLQRRSASSASARWRALLVRARELGHAPGVEEATGWLQGAG